MGLSGLQSSQRGCGSTGCRRGQGHHLRQSPTWRAVLPREFDRDTTAREILRARGDQMYRSIAVVLAGSSSSSGEQQFMERRRTQAGSVCSSMASRLEVNS